LTITVPLPPPTKQSREATANKSQSLGFKAQEALKKARLTTHKKFQSEKRNVRPDDLKKAEKKMEEVVKKGKTEIENIVATAKKVVMEG
jgi:ribosome recycling factor